MGDNGTIFVEVVLKPNDVYTPFRWDRGNVLRWVTAIVLCYIFYDRYQDSRATILSFSGGESILAIIVLLVLFILFALLLFPYLRVRAMFRKHPAMAKTRRYTFGATGVSVQSDDANSDCKWSLFRRVDETPRVFVFSLTSAGATYIPKRCFTSSEDIARMRELIRENMPGKWHLRRE